MAQNLLSLQFSPEQLSAMKATLAQLAQQLSCLISLSVADRRRLNKMGQRSEAFCRQTLSVLTANPQIVPPRLDIAEAIRDLTALEQLKPIFDQLEQLAERCRDTEIALGADVMQVALEGYALLKCSGKEQGLDSLRKEIGSRWSRGRRNAAGPEPASNPG